MDNAHVPAVGRTFRADLEVRAVDSNGDGFGFEGYAAVYDSLSQRLFDPVLGWFYERLNPGAFRSVLAGKPDVKLLVNHDPSLLLASTSGNTLTLTGDQRGLHVKADIAPTTLGNDLRVLLKRGDISQMSFAFSVAPGGERAEEGPDGTIRTITKVGELTDVSIVTYPAYTATNASVRSICGHNFFNDAADLKIDELRSLAWQIHRGEVEAREIDRDMIDALLRKTPHVSPWMAEQVTRAVEADDELRAAIQVQPAEVRSDEGTTGRPADITAELAAYDSRLRLAQIPRHRA